MEPLEPFLFKVLLSVAQVSNNRDGTKRAIIDVNSVVSGRNYDILGSIIAHFQCRRHCLTRAPSLGNSVFTCY